MDLKKIAPIVAIAAALLGIYFNYQMYKKAGKKCTCEDTTTNIGPL